MTDSEREKKSPTDKHEGAVMLVVMLIILVATASAAVAVHTTQAELHAAGQDRLALQTRYVSETAIMTTISWIDALGDDLQGVFDRWAPRPAPDMTRYGELPLTNDTRHFALRTFEIEQSTAGGTGNTPVFTQAPISLPPAGTGGSGGGSGGSSAPTDPDSIGSFGPRQAYGFPSDPASGNFVGYAVDLNDCVTAPPAYTPGVPIGHTNDGTVPRQLYCTVTARGRVVLPGAAAQRQWSFGASVYNQDPFACAHDSRATILTPTMWVPNPNH